MTRRACASGTFYPSNHDQLREKIHSVYRHTLGPGSLPFRSDTVTPSDTLAIISPHAGYDYSGPCAAHGFSFLLSQPSPDIYLFLGVSHTGDKTCFSDETWETPLGSMSPEALTIDLSRLTGISIDNKKHLQEHSIEVQIPFLQAQDEGSNARVPSIFLHIHRDVDTIEIGKLLADGLKGKSVHLVISSDFTHQGPRFGYNPFQENILDNVEKMDRQAINCITMLNIDDFMKFRMDTGATICGARPIQVGLSFLKERGIEKGRLLQYYTSGKITGDFDNTVSYASIAYGY